MKRRKLPGLDGLVAAVQRVERQRSGKEILIRDRGVTLQLRT